MTLSVIICTHNPRSDHLGRVLDALKAQTLPKEQWELLLVDNASNQSLSEKWDLTWHPNGRHIREEQLGKTPALRSVVPQAKASVLITVDDDNILAPDYLKWALKKMDQHAEVGVWSGTIVAEFERNPASWKQAFFPYMAINQENEDRISKDLESAPLPIGAGMVFRRELAQEYKLWMDPTTQIGKNGLSRRGSQLYAGEEDTELGIIAIRNGYACGRTPELADDAFDAAKENFRAVSLSNCQRHFLFPCADLPSARFAAGTDEYPRTYTTVCPFLAPGGTRRGER